MTNPNGHGGRRAGAGRPKSKNTLLREAAEQLLRDLPQLHHRRQSNDPVIDELRRLTAAVHRLRENQRSENESLQPILRRLTEIERRLRLTETPEVPRPSRGHPMRAWRCGDRIRSDARRKGPRRRPRAQRLRPHRSSARPA